MMFTLCEELQVVVEKETPPGSTRSFSRLCKDTYAFWSICDRRPFRPTCRSPATGLEPGARDHPRHLAHMLRPAFWTIALARVAGERTYGRERGILRHVPKIPKNKDFREAHSRWCTRARTKTPPNDSHPAALSLPRLREIPATRWSACASIIAPHPRPLQPPAFAIPRVGNGDHRRQSPLSNL